MGQQQVQVKKRKSLPAGFWIAISIVIILIVVLAVTSVWILTHQGITQGTATLTIISIVGGLVVALFAALFTYLQWRYPVSPATAEPVSTPPTSQTPSSSAPIIIQLQQQASPTIPQPTPILDKPISSSIIGTFPPTDAKTIQQRHSVVEQVYSELTKSDITCIVLTGIGGIGKSTVAALVYRYAEEQRKGNTGPFTAESLWFTVEATTNFADLAGMVSTALDKPIPGFGQLPPQNQAVALFHILNITDNPRLVVMNQFENFLDGQTGQATDPGLGEWIDMLNSQPCRCRVLLTSRPTPRGTNDFPPTRMQEYHVKRLETNEGVELLRKQGVQTTQAKDAELLTAVERCDGHALSLELLASILRRNRSLSLKSLFHNPTYTQLWTGDIAHNLLDYIYEQQLNELQRKLLAAFSVYREPVLLEAAQAVVDAASATKTPGSLLDALNVLLAQHLLQDSGNECYQLHIIVANYAKDHFDTVSEEANRQVLRGAHAKAAQYYVQYADRICPPHDKRRNADDVKPLIEAVWQYYQSGQCQEAYDLMVEEGLFSDLRRWGRNTLLLELCLLLLPSREWQPEHPQAARIYAELGSVYDALGKKQEALAYYQQALDIYREVGNRGGEGTTLNNLGLVYDALGKKQEALASYQQALDISREVGDRGGEGTTLNNLGLVYDALGKKQEALASYQQALSILREVGDRGTEGTTLHNIGTLHFEQSRYDVALAFFLLTRGIFEEVLSPNRDAVQGWIDALRRRVGEEQFATLLARVEPQAQHVVEQALRQGL